MIWITCPFFESNVGNNSNQSMGKSDRLFEIPVAQKCLPVLSKQREPKELFISQSSLLKMQESLNGSL